MSIRIAMIGCGGIALQNHLPGFALIPQAKVVALCDTNPAVLDRARQQTGIDAAYTDYHQALAHPKVNAVVIATPNVTHAPIALAAIAAGKHVLLEKPIAMNLDEAKRLLDAARKAKIVHMTAFTYRFVPAMRYMAHLVKAGHVGEPWHFRAQRFQDWSDRNLAWRQVKALAATGELGDMLSHRIDFALNLVGPIARLAARLKQFIPTRGNQPSDLDDWVSILADFQSGATGVLESTKLATGRGEGAKSPDVCEINGPEGTLVYQVGKPHEIQIGKRGGAAIESRPVPKDFLKIPNSPRDPHAGDPLQTFRYDQNYEFIEAILQTRPASPSFEDGAKCQAVMDTAVQSDQQRQWLHVPQI